MEIICSLKLNLSNIVLISFYEIISDEETTHCLILSNVDELIISLSISIVFSSSIHVESLQHFLKKLTDFPARKMLSTRTLSMNFGTMFMSIVYLCLQRFSFLTLMFSLIKNSL